MNLKFIIILNLFLFSACSTSPKIHSTMALTRLIPLSQKEDSAEDTRIIKNSQKSSDLKTPEEAIYSEELKAFPNKWTDAAADKAGFRKTLYIHYIAEGGESIEGIVLKFTSDLFLVEQVLRENPAITNRGPLTKGDHLRIPMTLFRPQIDLINPEFLKTYKDSLKNYFKELCQWEGLEVRSYTVQRHDTYEMISQIAYNTPKRWKEIFMYNLDKLDENQKLNAGQTINYLVPIGYPKSFIKSNTNTIKSKNLIFK